MSPINRKDIDAGLPLKQVSATQNINELFRMERTARVASDGCVRMFNNRFEIPDALPGSTLTIYYLPWDNKHIFIEPDMTVLKPLDLTKNATRFDKPRRGLFLEQYKNRRQSMKNQHKPPLSALQFFGYRYPPFADTFEITEPYISDSDALIVQRVSALLRQGKSVAIHGDAGTGKSMLVKSIVSQLD